MKRLILIDGNAILHRAFHAIPPTLTTKEGSPINAVYGFFSMFLKIQIDLRPECIVVCFDRKAPTFRKQMYVGYQAKRPKMDDTLVPQIIKLHEVLESAKIPIFEIDGYEADDLIGTIAHQAVKGKDAEVIILTGDRDMLQLVNSNVKVLAPIVGLTKMILFDEKTVEEKYGIKPSQFIDYKALVGDSSDNYPGVTGIGPKTARDLLVNHGNLEYLYEHLGELPPKIMERLSQDAEQASLAKRLATIVTDAPIKFELDKATCSNFSMENLKKAFEKLGFNSLLKRISDPTTLSLRGASKGQETRDKKQEIAKKQEAEQMGLL